MSEIVEHESRQKTGARKNNKKIFIKVDLTPMVDLGFLLISFFVFTTSLAQPTAMKLVLPDDSNDDSGKAPVSKTLNLLLAANNKVCAYNGDSLSQLRNLGASTAAVRAAIVAKKNSIRRHYGTDSGMIVLIKPTPQATYGNLVDALDEMQICAIRTYVLMEPSKSELEKIHQP